MTDFRHIENWVFDLDNTLYKAECRLFAQIDARMTQFIRERLDLEHADARRLQKQYYVDYGTTMSGLMHEHDVCPETFMAYVHDIDLAPIRKNPALEKAIAALPGRKFIYTNGSTRHAENVAGALGVFHLFDEVFDIKAAGYTPKPHRAPYEKFLTSHDIDPAKAAMFEDIAVNLEVPSQFGMVTVLVETDTPWQLEHANGEPTEFVDYTITCLVEFLTTVEASIRAPSARASRV